MSLISIDEAKQHLRIDHNYDDADIQSKLDAAELLAMEFLQRKVYTTQDEVENSNDDRPLLINAIFKAGVMLILGDLYANREDTLSNTALIPQSSQRILETMRINTGV